MIELKEHNKRPFEELKAKLSEVDRCAYISATGIGKSYVGGRLVEDEGYKALILVPSLEIAKGWRELLPGVFIETYQGLHKADLDGVDLLICDEMHHLGAEVWGEKFNSLIDGYNGKILGLTATPVRFLDKGRNMVEELFEGNQVVGVELPEAIEKGLLPSFDYITALFNLPSYMPDSKYRNETTEKLYAKLDTMGNRYSFQNILRKHMKGGGHKVVVFASAIDEISGIMKIVKEVYPAAGHFQAHSGMTDDERRMALDAFRDEQGLAFLYTVDLLNEGVHIPGIDTAVMFRRTESPNVYLQQIGRVLSADMSGKRVQIFDFVANHDSVKACLGTGNGVIEWIQDGIGNSERQIVVRDYAMEEWEILKKLNNRIFRLWENDTDRKQFYDDLRKWYLTEGGLDKLEEMYPDMERRYIIKMANKMGLKNTTPRERLPRRVRDYMMTHPELTADEIQKEFPDVPRQSILQFRVRHGLTKREEYWTAERIQILRGHPELSTPELQRRFFPERAIPTIYEQRKLLGWVSPNAENWDTAKVERFKLLYRREGIQGIRKSEEFCSLDASEIKRRVKKYDIRMDSYTPPIPWTEDELRFLKALYAETAPRKRNWEKIYESFPNHGHDSIRKMAKSNE